MGHPDVWGTRHRFPSDGSSARDLSRSRLLVSGYAVLIDQLSIRRRLILEISLRFESGRFGGQRNVASQRRGPAGPQIRNTQSVSGRCGRSADAPGLGAGGRRTSCHQRDSAWGLCLRLLRLFAVRMRTQWLLWAGIFPQRHLPGRGSVGELGLRPRLG
jgi:hypothetical protein